MPRNHYVSPSITSRLSHILRTDTGKAGMTKNIKRRQSREGAVIAIHFPLLTISMIVTSGGERTLIGGPHVPVPRLTYRELPPPRSANPD